ncbi:aquaporin [Sulfitobacter donghicola]|uniref:Aquaporin n=1 Tax=Sulfitobacter donghicola DSW-25 = KCTC 12864 = JCM 14565 TaxID=1300350 RepID=A0A073IL93_9RHOB|nr:aquaporin [Sulfitobacter donghicola]KEJ90281.1 aquaporin [Sulfitobacter donghicola DSW-25 = KCTC 12864 = JCM 14565]KIN66546.1 Aquaporin Z [Sulfitobacter donghicola DSW-25 = KCTC 12864 = JCM 14565]
MRKYIAEAIGTFVLVFFGVGSAVLAGGGMGLESPINITGISLAFGISVVAMAYSIGQISGAHLNPAVSMGALVAGRINMADFIGYALFQTLGAIIAAGVIYTLATNSAGGYDVAANGMGQNGWGAGYGGEFFMISAFLFEVIATAVFLVVILGVTSGNGSPMMAGLVIGLTLTMIHLVGITITGTSVNPARSVGPALFVGGTALAQLWVFIVAPLIGGAIGGLLHRARITGSDD